MAGKNTAAFGIFTNRAAAETAVDRLSAAGFSHDDVSALMNDQTHTRDFAAEKNTKAPEGTTTGVTVGGIAGGTLGLLAGLGALAIPGVGPLVAAGPIMGALAGLGVGGAVGGLIGALVGLGIPEYEAKRYEGRVKDGGILVSVHCESSEEVSRAKEVLRQSGGEDVASAGEKGVSTHTANTDQALSHADTYDRKPVTDRVDTYDRTPATDRVDTYDRTAVLDREDSYNRAVTTRYDDRETGNTRRLDETRDDVVVNDRKPIISTPE